MPFELTLKRVENHVQNAVRVEIEITDDWFDCLKKKEAKRLKLATVGIQLKDTSGNQMVKSSPIADWSVNWMVTWIEDKKSGN